MAAYGFPVKGFTESDCVAALMRMKQELAEKAKQCKPGSPADNSIPQRCPVLCFYSPLIFDRYLAQKGLIFPLS